MKCSDPNCYDPGAGPLTLAPVIGADSGKSPPPLFLCLPCIQRLGLWCAKHQLVHASFQDGGGHVCLPCIDEDVRARQAEADDIASRLNAALPATARKRLQDWAERAGRMSGNHAVTILRAVLIAAQRRQVTAEQVVAEVCADHDVANLLQPLI